MRVPVPWTSILPRHDENAPILNIVYFASFSAGGNAFRAPIRCCSQILFAIRYRFNLIASLQRAIKFHMGDPRILTQPWHTSHLHLGRRYLPVCIIKRERSAWSTLLKYVWATPNYCRAITVIPQLEYQILPRKIYVGCMYTMYSALCLCGRLYYTSFKISSARINVAFFF